MIPSVEIAAQPPLDWTQLGPDISGLAPFDRFGTSLAMSDDGTFVVVGSVPRNIFGVVRIYQKDPSDQTYKQFGSDIRSQEPGDQ